MNSNTDLAGWLDRLEKLHPNEIELGLDRVNAVRDHLSLKKPAPCVISVAGTNGKGSSVAMLEALLMASGRSVLAYTSPHLVHYNERVRLNAVNATDQMFCNAFEAIEVARADIPLTYFEFGTLAAMWLAARFKVDVAILEVGLGGRLDAVNTVAADAALITSIGIDHEAWLGSDRETIGYEKAGIFRPDQIAVCADPSTPRSVSNTALSLGARYFERNKDFNVSLSAEGFWELSAQPSWQLSLPKINLVGRHQLNNAAGCLMLLQQMDLLADLSLDQISEAMSQSQVPGRCQVLKLDGQTELVLDVAHNPDSAKALAEILSSSKKTTHAVFAALADKDVRQILSPMLEAVSYWYLAGLDVPRGQSVEQLVSRLQAIDLSEPHCYPTIAEAFMSARKNAADGDRIVVFGSFFTVAAIQLLLGLVELE